MEHAKIVQQARKLQQSEDAYLQVQRASEAITAATLDRVGLDIKVSRATFAQIGLDRYDKLLAFDKALQCLLALMTIRADLRMGVFSLWLFSHVVYTGSLLFYQFAASELRLETNQCV